MLKDDHVSICASDARRPAGPNVSHDDAGGHRSPSPLRRVEVDHYEILSPAADALAAKHPLAAILLLRAMIEFALKENRVKRYRHAARHLAECASLAVAVGDFGNFEPHTAHV